MIGLLLEESWKVPFGNFVVKLSQSERLLQGHSVNNKLAQAHEQCNFLKNKKVAI